MPVFNWDAQQNCLESLHSCRKCVCIIRMDPFILCVMNIFASWTPAVGGDHYFHWKFLQNIFLGSDICFEALIFVSSPMWPCFFFQAGNSRINWGGNSKVKNEITKCVKWFFPNILIVLWFNFHLDVLVLMYSNFGSKENIKNEIKNQNK